MSAALSAALTAAWSALIASRAPAACFVAMGVVWGSFMAAMPDVKAALGVDDGAMGLLLIWGSVAAIAMMTLAPRLGTPLGRAALPGFTVLMGLALASMGTAGGAAGFVLALMAMGTATGALDVFMNARLSAIETRRGGSLMNLNHGLYSLAFASGAALTGVARAAGWGIEAILWTAAAVVVTLGALAWERDGIIGGLGGKGASAKVRLGIVPLLGGVLILAGLMSENAVEAWSALYIERDLGGAHGAGSMAPALMGLTMGFGRLLGQGVALRVADRHLLRGGLVLAVFGVGLVVAAQGPLGAYAGFIVMGLGASVVVPTVLSMIGRLSQPEARSRAIARATVLGYLGYFLGPPLLGLAAELAGLRASFTLVALILMGSMLVASGLVRQDR